MPDQEPCDGPIRSRVTTDLTTTYLLEAGAGTGKTRVLVDRYVQCVLDPDLGSGDARAVAAITFTEKAAGELRQRIREKLERLDAAAVPGSVEADRLSAALDALDDAPIGTIHGFAGRLLREFPVEAGVDPAFEQLDGLGSDLERARLWQEWVTELAAGGTADVDGPRAWVRRLLRAGVRLDHLRTLAIGKGGVFAERYDVRPVGSVDAEPDFADSLRVLYQAVDDLRGFCDAACGDPSDGGLQGALKLCGSCERVVTGTPADMDELMAQVYRVSFTEKQGGLGGRKDNWSDAYGGKDALWERYQAATRELVALRDAYAGYLTGLAVAVADAFSRWAGEKQIELGKLDFTDLLGRLRDLLLDDLDARRLLQRRFRYVLVDEFQDTDPLQAEIVFFLCEREPVAADWRHVVLEPGKLFVVGDPKQSIYRFRRADIAMYDEVKDLVEGQPDGGGKVEAIEQNFRTTPTVVAWVNNVFATLFDHEQEKGRQPGYQWVKPYRLPVDGSRVTVLLGPPYDGSAGSTEAARRDEASAVAAAILAMRGDDAGRWPIHEGERPGRPRRRARPAGPTSPCCTAPPPVSRRWKRPCERPACRTGWTAARRTSSGARSTTRFCACAPWTTPATDRRCTGRCTRRSSGSPTTPCSCSGPTEAASISSPSLSRRLTRASRRRCACCVRCTSRGPSVSHTSCSGGSCDSRAPRRSSRPPAQAARRRSRTWTS